MPRTSHLLSGKGCFRSHWTIYLPVVFTFLIFKIYSQKKYKEDAEKSMSSYETVLDTPEMLRVRENQKNFSLVSVYWIYSTAHRSGRGRTRRLPLGAHGWALPLQSAVEQSHNSHLSSPLTSGLKPNQSMTDPSVTLLVISCRWIWTIIVFISGNICLFISQLTPGKVYI